MMKQAVETGTPPKRVMVFPSTANADKADAEQRKGKRGALPAVRGEVEGDKGGDNAETDGAKGQPRAVRPDFSHHRVKGRSGAGGHLDVPRVRANSRPMAATSTTTVAKPLMPK